MNNLTALLADDADYMIDDPDLSFWLNVSVPEIKIEFAHFDISPQISFEAMTFELPVNNDTMRNISVTGTDNTTWHIEVFTSESCTDDACLLQMPGKLEDQVRLMAICMTEAGDESLNQFAEGDGDSSGVSCPVRSNSSVLVVSVAHHVSADEFNSTYYQTMNHDAYKNVIIHNPRVTYSVTVGRLSWKTEDLAQVFNAECSPGVNCSGLNFPLSNGEQELVLGEAQLPSAKSIPYPSTYKSWQSLVQASAGTGSLTSDIIYPPDIPMAAGSIPWTRQSGHNCSFYGSQYINSIMQRHIYSKDPVQAAYTSGLFWLFQNAVVKDIEMTSDNNTSLNFEGHRKWISSGVSIPATSALVTFAGCLVVVIVAIMVTVWAKDGSNSHLLPREIANVMVNPSEYPPLLVRTLVDTAATKTPDQDIQDFEITEVTLQNRTQVPARVLTIGHQTQDTAAIA